MKKLIINSKEEMIQFAQEMAKSAEIGDVIGLNGTLGVGKSFFAKNFINFLQNESTEVLSPTFNIVYPYDSKKGEIFHFDLYRLKSDEELENIGFFDSLQNGICLIEWPEIAQDFLKKNYLEITIKTTASVNEEEREILIKGNSQANQN